MPMPEQQDIRSRDGLRAHRRGAAHAGGRQRFRRRPPDARGEVALSRVFEAFVGHCRLDVRFRNPYSGSGKGGVEDAVGFLRRDLMVPPMEAETRERLTRLMPAKRDGLGRSIRYRTPDPIDMVFADDVKSLRPLPSRVSVQ